MPDWFVISPTRLPRTSAGGCSTKTSTPGRTTGADAHADAAATSRAVNRFMISVTCYASRPRLQPHARRPRDHPSMPPSQLHTPLPGPHHHSPGSRACGVPARRLLVLLVAAWAQGPVARWTPDLAFSVKRVGSVAISPDGRWAAVEVSDPLMEAEPSEWRTSVCLYAVGGATEQAPRRVETPARAPGWAPGRGLPPVASGRAGERGAWAAGADGPGGAGRAPGW